MKKNLYIITIFSITTIMIIVLFLNAKGYFMQSQISKEEIIKVFNNNYKRFEYIYDFAKIKNINFLATNDKNDISIMFYTSDGKKAEYDNSIYSDSLFILKDLKFKIISAEKDQVRFISEVGGYEQGILCLKSSDKPDYFRHIELIKSDKWYYYWTTHE